MDLCEDGFFFIYVSVLRTEDSQQASDLTRKCVIGQKIYNASCGVLDVVSLTIWDRDVK